MNSITVKKEVPATRIQPGVLSSNNNVFIYSSYWRSWSRILFHDDTGNSRGGVSMREEYVLPSGQQTIEVNVYDSITATQKRNHKVVIRSHMTSINNSKISMALPLDITNKVLTEYEPDICNMILHVDLLKYIDFNKLKGPKNNGGCELEDCLVDGLTIHKLNQILLTK